MNVTPDTLGRIMKETCEELEELADLLVNINSAKHDQIAIQGLVLDALTRIETCKLILDFEAVSLNRVLSSALDGNPPRSN